MLTAYPMTTLALIAALLVYFGLGVVVGGARAKYGVPAPQASGHPEFDKRNRVHMNTLEQLALLVPAVIVGAPVLGDMVAAGLTAVWSLGRILYARAYYADPAKRGPGFGLTFLPTLILLVAGIWGGISALI
ncbi:MAPEG family protein [Sandarakinorhabdus sp. AAP62]|uniref:MAPEG family protein n=1 Tax=Sandarakinorhabdus sp. AAP62 TaxID=1248916 RepID=UPI00036C9E4A|nr:MAPEG family protein [Sandarakinorhabdus sp. AAP62]